jgi:tripartite-type tricarboxylate transporter receptor subunit TctC
MCPIAARLRLTDLLGGQVQVTFDNMPSSIEHIRAGKLRALAVTTAHALRGAADTPVVADFVPGYEASAWFGLGAPKGTPAEIDRQAQQGDQRSRCRPECEARLADMGGMMMPGSPAEFGKIIGRRDREVGQGGEVLRREGGVSGAMLLQAGLASSISCSCYE